ncbi:tRNA dihydrouridine(20/20a) synthase DusA [Devosia sp. MC532]|uniref:tRNA dihydrouridine(20/20a) synthase DusA n=1 Tax=Devosia sp. MC532 TaxID=2799788 RepID=UPI0018F42599|nr:tRNA dihydrouridine(20/20a) synthase DusA [Devosia sp. MC532]MBJ7578045.1 tRNA dihydrouridine(20/20a) synthase DusA [Devosia sp. MC532]
MDTQTLKRSRRFSVAPMLDWTDRHCRVLHRMLTRNSLLFTEMVTTGAIVHGDANRHLRFDPVEQPVALQLGGSDPAELAAATKIAESFGYNEINLNVGCPSDRVQSGRFGACLMAEPDLVADCVKAMRDATSLPITVKCRIGIDDQDIEESLDRFADKMVEAEVDALYVHARKAWLKGLSPKENRTIPPLEYARVYRLKQRLPHVQMLINGGIETFEQVDEHMQHMDGVMVGRAAYHNPMLMAEVDARLFDDTRAVPDFTQIVSAMADYAEGELAKGTRLNNIARHMLGLANGRPGARQFRQIMSVDACKAGAGPEVFARAVAVVEDRAVEEIA